MKTMLVTGAAQGVGLATSTVLAQRGYRVILLDIRSLDEPLARLRGEGAQVEGVSGDVSSEAFVLELSRSIARDYGAIDGLVNNAGISLIMPAEQTSAAQWQRVMDINLLGPFLLCRYLGAQMLERRQGCIVNVASVAGLAGISHRSAYNASKHGLIGLTKTLAAEWGGRGVGQCGLPRLDQNRHGCCRSGCRRLQRPGYRGARADGPVCPGAGCGGGGCFPGRLGS